MGLHECPHCHYRFEDDDSLEDHLDGGCPEADSYDVINHR